MSLSFSVDVILDKDGTVDQAATLHLAKTKLFELAAQLETELTIISEAVSTVFDAHKGTPIPMPALVALTVNRLNAQPENHMYLSERVANYVRLNALSDNADSLFLITKGKGGGVSRRSDIKK